MSMFTRRHYVWLASVCRDMRHVAIAKSTTSTVDEAIGILRDALANESIGFDSKQFDDAVFNDPINKNLEEFLK